MSDPLTISGLRRRSVRWQWCIFFICIVAALSFIAGAVWHNQHHHPGFNRFAPPASEPGK